VCRYRRCGAALGRAAAATVAGGHLAAEPGRNATRGGSSSGLACRDGRAFVADE
jgi:hypothetical protein